MWKPADVTCTKARTHTYALCMWLKHQDFKNTPKHITPFDYHTIANSYYKHQRKWNNKHLPVNRMVLMWLWMIFNLAAIVAQFNAIDVDPWRPVTKAVCVCLCVHVWRCARVFRFVFVLFTLYFGHQVSMCHFLHLTSDSIRSVWLIVNAPNTHNRIIYRIEREKNNKVRIFVWKEKEKSSSCRDYTTFAIYCNLFFFAVAFVICCCCCRYFCYQRRTIYWNAISLRQKWYQSPKYPKVILNSQIKSICADIFSCVFYSKRLLLFPSCQCKWCTLKCTTPSVRCMCLYIESYVWSHGHQINFGMYEMIEIDKENSKK